MRRTRLPMAFLLATLLVLFGIPGCGEEDDGFYFYGTEGDNGGGGSDDTGDTGGGSGDTGGGSGDNGGGSGDGHIDPDRQVGPDGDDICDIMSRGADGVPPNMMLVVDKSGSMDYPISVNRPGRKVEDLKSALDILLDLGQDEIRFGWLQYPGDSRCEPGRVSIACDEGTTDDIRSLVGRLTPGGGTPTGGSLLNAFENQSLHDESRANYVVLLTDGVPTCPAGNGQVSELSDKNMTLDAIRTLYASRIQTFVIGIGEDLNNVEDGKESKNPELLNQMAEAGGRARDGGVKYFPANSREELEAALENIGGMVIGCTFPLNPEPQDPGNIWVNFDDKWIDRDRDHVDGWDYDRNVNQISFYGPACDLLRAGEVDLVEILMGCKRYDDPDLGWNVDDPDSVGGDNYDPSGGGDNGTGDLDGSGGSGDYEDPDVGWNVDDPGDVNDGGEECDPTVDDTCQPR